MMLFALAASSCKKNVLKVHDVRSKAGGCQNPCCQIADTSPRHGSHVNAVLHACQTMRSWARCHMLQLPFSTPHILSLQQSGNEGVYAKVLSKDPMMNIKRTDSAAKRLRNRGHSPRKPAIEKVSKPPSF